jgi:hypothetical protein
MRLIHYGQFAGMCTVKIDGKFYQLPSVIDLDSPCAKRRYRCPNGVINEQSTDGTQYFSFTHQHFYKLGRQLAKM